MTAVIVAVGSAIAAALSDRGRSYLEDRAKIESKLGPQLYMSRVDRVDDPILIGVHPAAALDLASGRTDRVPPFVVRDRMPDLETALRDGGFVLVVGESTAGKTRLAYEAMRTCLPGHRLIRPKDRTALPAAIAAAKENKPCVVWLDDLEIYLGTGGLTAPDLAGLFDPGAGRRVVVLATMRAHERARFSPRRDRSTELTDRELARTGREVIDLATEIRLEREWSIDEIARARELTRDIRIVQALDKIDEYGLAEYMAAGPQLLKDWKDAWSPLSGNLDRDLVIGGPRGAALVAAAVDVRRAGYHRPLSIEILRNLHEVYLRRRGGVRLRPESWAEALAWATQTLHATTSLLQPAENSCYLAFDYLVEATALDESAHPVPDATWLALIEWAEPIDIVGIAWEATFAGRTEHVLHAFEKTLAAKQYVAAAGLAECLGDAGRESDAADLFERTIAKAEESAAVSPEDLLTMREKLAWCVGEKVDGQGDPKRALDIIRRVARDSAAIHGDTHTETLNAKIGLARQTGATGNPQEALAIAGEVVADATQFLGPDHRATLSARFEVAVWVRRTDGPADAAQLFGELLKYMEAYSAILIDG